MKGKLKKCPMQYMQVVISRHYIHSIPYIEP